jgi:hypothetical protein
MSTITYRYNQRYEFLKKGVKHNITETVIDGTAGLTIMYKESIGEESYKFYAREDLNEKEKFSLTETKNNVDEAVKTVKMSDILKLLKKYKLDVIINYVSNERGSYKGKKVSKKPTKKSKKTKNVLDINIDMLGGKPKKSSKKVSKKVSKKSSKKVTK